MPARTELWQATVAVALRKGVAEALLAFELLQQRGHLFDNVPGAESRRHRSDEYRPLAERSVSPP